MTGARYVVGDSCEVLRSLPAGSVDLVLTSPPFLALRSYLPADHPAKHLEMGSEPTPGDYIDSLLGWTEEVARVLAPHGSLVVELGDTYAGSGGAGGDYNADGLRAGQAKFDGSNHRRGKIVDHDSGRRTPGPGWPLDKSLCLIPELYRIALVYGFNPLTGRQTPAWRARNVVRWCRPNPPVGALGDKVRPATSDMVVACKSRTRYFDLDAVRTPFKQEEWSGGTSLRRPIQNDTKDEQAANVQTQAGAPPLDHWWHDDEFDQDAWLIPTEPYRGAHYAVWPTALLVKPILAMCPQRVCATCGEPSRRIVSEPTYERTDTDRVSARLTMLDGVRPAEGVNQHVRPDGANTSVIRVTDTIGWTTCGHDTWRPGVTLDPFAGTGTTLVVATGHGRDAIGIDLDPRNAQLARERVGMFLSVEDHESGEVVA